jgi:hypothetical protein
VRAGHAGKRRGPHGLRRGVRADDVSRQRVPMTRDSGFPPELPDIGQ